MTNEEAAKMLIVGWAKNWHMRTLAKTISGNIDFGNNEDDATSLNKQFRFMTKMLWIYTARGKGFEVKRYVADYLPSINDKLWAYSGDVKKMMTLAPRVATTPAINKSVGSKEAREVSKDTKRCRANAIASAAYLEHKNRCNRKGWGIVK